MVECAVQREEGKKSRNRARYLDQCHKAYTFLVGIFILAHPETLAYGWVSCQASLICFFFLSLTYHLLRVRLIQHCVCLNFGLSRRQHDTYEIRSTNIIIVLLSQIEHCIRTHP